MKRIERIKKFIENEINNLLDKEDTTTKKIFKKTWSEEDKIERMFNITIEKEKGQEFIAVYTDGDVYNLLFQNYNSMEIPCNNREKIEKAINKKFRFKKDDHYFELYGMGRLDYFI